MQIATKPENLQQEQIFRACVVLATEARVGGGGTKSIFVKYLNLNSKLKILNNFPNVGGNFPTNSKRNNQKARRKKQT